MATELLDNPVIKDEAISDDAFLEAASLADKGQDIPTDLFQQKPSEQAINAEKPEAVKPETTKTEVKPERPRDSLGRFTKTEDGKDIPENERQPVEAKTDKPETPYTKAQKERERQENLLKNFEQEKQRARAEIEQAREQLRREAAELQRAKQSGTVPNRPVNQQFRYSSAELLEAADEYEKQAVQAFDQGDREAFVKGLETAKAARQQAGQVQALEQRSTQQEQAQRFQEVYVQVMDQTMKAEPDLTKPDSTLSKEVSALLEQEPVFNHMPDGFAKAVQLAKMKMEAMAAAELRQTVKTLKEENDRLNGLTQLNGSGPTPAPSQKTFDSMSPTEKDEFLLRQAQRFDQGG